MALASVRSLELFGRPRLTGPAGRRASLPKKACIVALPLSSGRRRSVLSGIRSAGTARFADRKGLRRGVNAPQPGFFITRKFSPASRSREPIAAVSRRERGIVTHIVCAGRPATKAPGYSGLRKSSVSGNSVGASSRGDRHGPGRSGRNHRTARAGALRPRRR